tara:strand:- start:518 stop:1075 length:558 start_codon:yes stop_codon:yes gene_type:complete
MDLAIDSKTENPANNVADYVTEQPNLTEQTDNEDEELTSEMKPLSAEQINAIVSEIPLKFIHPNVLKLFFKPRVQQRTDEWLELRKGVLTASDAAAALGINPYQSRTQLLRRKIMPAQKEFSPKFACEWGKKWEDPAADLYMRRNPTLAPFFEFGLIMHDIHPFLGASPDRITADGILIEIKVTN